MFCLGFTEIEEILRKVFAQNNAFFDHFLAFFDHF